MSQSPFVVLPEAPPAEIPDAIDSEPALLITLPNGVQVSLMPGSVWIPDEEIQARMDELPRDKPIVLYCWDV